MNILLVKTSSLGDIVQSFAVIALIKKRYPDAKIDWVAEESSCELLESHPDLNRIIPIHTRKWKKSLIKSCPQIRSSMKSLRSTKYQLLIDLQGNVKSGLITRLARAEMKIGYTFATAPEWPGSLFLTHRYAVNSKDPITAQYLSLIEQHWDLPHEPIDSSIKLKISSDEERWIETQLDNCSPPFFMVSPNSRWENKKLPLTTWKIFLQRVEEELSPTFFVVWGTEKEKREAEELQTHFPKSLHLLPRMRLPVWQRFMERMDRILTVDSGALHLAATTSTPTFSLFGPSKGGVYKPLGSSHIALQGPCPYNTPFKKRCPALRTCKTGACLKELSPHEIAKTFLQHR